MAYNTKGTEKPPKQHAKASRIITTADGWHFYRCILK